MGLKPRRESGILAAVLDWFRIRGGFPIRINSGGLRVGKRYVRFHREPGCSDALVCWRGRFVSVETKKPGATTDPRRQAEQRSFARQVEKAGGVALVDLTSVAELEADLKEAGLL